jgi:hypothetical protein
MSTQGFLRAVVELAACESVPSLLVNAVTVMESELGVRASIELWDVDGSRFFHGDTNATTRPTWVGTRYTIGAIHVGVDCDPAAVETLARQLAPLAELLMDRDASQRRTIREDIERLYERRIRDALVRSDWNASAVARELAVSRNRIASVARRHKAAGRTALWESR